MRVGVGMKGVGGAEGMGLVGGGVGSGGRCGCGRLAIPPFLCNFAAIFVLPAGCGVPAGAISVNEEMTA